MAKIIEADLLLQLVENLEAYNMGRASCFKKPKGLTPEGIRHMIDTMPKVDAVPVVRCKDCKHYDNSEGIFWCHLNSKFYKGGMDWHGFPEDGFCSYGERKDNE